MTWRPGLPSGGPGPSPFRPARAVFLPTWQRSFGGLGWDKPPTRPSNRGYHQLGDTAKARYERGWIRPHQKHRIPQPGPVGDHALCNGIAERGEQEQVRVGDADPDSFRIWLIDQPGQKLG